MAELTRTTLAIEKDLLGRFDAWMARHGYSNRSEAVRDLMRAGLTEEEWANPEAQMVAVLTIVYDHASRQLAQELTGIQHEDPHVVLCSQHVHLDRHRCLESIVMRGTAAQLRRVSNSIIAARGVQAGRLTPMSQDL